jgi:hypothetical protein
MMTDADILRKIGRGDAPCCPFGTRDIDWGPAAVGLARLSANSDGRVDPTDDEIDAAASTIVNSGDCEAWSLHCGYPEHIPEPVHVPDCHYCTGHGDVYGENPATTTVNDYPACRRCAEND